MFKTTVMQKYTRREASKLMGAALIGASVVPSLSSFSVEGIRKRKILSSGEDLPVVGLGTWQTFDAGENDPEREQLLEVLLKMKAQGGTMIDSSPMYGRSEQVVGDLTVRSGFQEHFFYATKVWTSGRQAGIEQMRTSMKQMRRKSMDLMQIHNLVDWETHVKTLKAWKEEEKIRYWGITHYTNSSHDTLARIIKNEKPDFAQFNYSMANLHAEKGLLSAAKDNGVSVIINRPYHGGSLFRLTKGKELPGWCEDYAIKSWGQFFLKYIISHPAVTCVIPGTSKPRHMIDNMMAGYGKLPDAATRKKMRDLLKNL